MKKNVLFLNWGCYYKIKKTVILSSLWKLGFTMESQQFYDTTTRSCCVFMYNNKVIYLKYFNISQDLSYMGVNLNKASVVHKDGVSDVT